MTTIIPLHPEDGPIWTDADCLAVTWEAMSVRVFQVGSFFYWKVDHPNLANNRAGPFKTAIDAHANMAGWDREDDEPAEIPSLLPGRIAMGALDATAEKLVMKMLDSNDPAEQAKARELIEKYSYD